MIKLIGTVYKRDDFTMREFFDYWRDTHAAISAKSGPLRGDVTSEVISKLENPHNPTGEGEIQVDAFVEQRWDDEETLYQAMSTQNESEVWEDVRN